MSDQVMIGQISVLVCDDHELVRRGLAALLGAEAGIRVIGEAANAEEAVAAAATLQPDVVVMDVRMPGRSGVEACRDIRSLRPSTKVLMLTSFADDEALFTSIMAGAVGFILKQIKGSDLVGAIRQVARGQSLLDPAVAQRVMARLRGESWDSADLGGMTSQESRVLALVADGLTNRQISERMHLAETTVKNYVSSILTKLDLSRRTQVAAFMAKRQRTDRTDWG